MLLCLTPARAQKWEGFASTPQMGWSSWNCFQCNINETQLKEIADIMVEKGLVDAGYEYLNMDDGWHAPRDSRGFIHEDPQKFPSGLKALADYVHAKGMKIGIYSCAGRKTCAGYAGSSGHEYQDAISYAEWEMDYLKYDWCYHDGLNAAGAYNLMRDALYSAGRPIFFSMCEWGSSNPWEWAAETGHSWRSTGDIGPAFDADLTIYDENGNPSWRPLSVVEIIDKNEPLRAYAGPGHWNDPDMLEVGNGMSATEDRAHFTLWCMMAAPLILGNDLRTMSDETLAIITNRGLIAVDQDPLGVQGLRLRKEGSIEYWFKPLEGGDWAFCLLNRSEEDAVASVDWTSLDFTDDLSGRSTLFSETTYTLKNLWDADAAEIQSRVKGKGRQRKMLLPNNFEVSVPGHAVVVWRLVKN